MIDLKKINANINIGILDLVKFSVNRPGHQKRELERAGSLFLLTKMLKTASFELGYHETNKPFLKDRTEHISITHSHDKLAIIINQTENTGIDIELIRDKVIKIQHKFLNETERLFAKENIEKLITLWAAKEALYKVYGLKELDFKKNIFIEEFDNSLIFGKIETASFTNRYKLIHETIDEYKLVYVLNEL